VISGPYTEGGVILAKKEVSIVAWLAMKSLLMGTGRYLCKVYNYHDSQAYGYKRSGISFDYMVWMGMGWYWPSLCGIFVITLCPFVPL
jgi:hypothetical protein